MKYLRVNKDRLGRVRLTEENEVERNLKERVLIIDTNLAFDHAMRFVEEGLDVYYWIANLSAFPSFDDQISGDGFGLLKIDDWGEVIDKVGLVYITDNCFPQLTMRLRELGKNVYGPTPEFVRWEQDRGYGYSEMKSRGIAVPDGAVVKGKTKLLEWIEGNLSEGERVWVKISAFRGNIETFSVSSAQEADTMLSQAGFGPYAEELEFLLEKNVDGVEIGCDGWVVPDGVLEPIAFTLEEKGRGNIAVFQRNSDFIDEWYSKVHDVVESTDYRCNLSVEGIWNGKELSVLEPTPRNPYPVSSLYPRFVKNWVDVVWGVAEGKLVDVEVDWDNPYLMELTVGTSDTDTWRVIDGVEDLVSWTDEGIGFRKVVKKDGQYWFVPGDGIVATVNVKGESVDECIIKAKEMADKIRCMGSEYDGTIVDSMKEKIETLNEGDKFQFVVKE
jgi:hypothetical protein